MKFKWEKDEEAAFEKLKNAVANSTTNMYFDPNKTMLRTEASIMREYQLDYFKWHHKEWNQSYSSADLS